MHIPHITISSCNVEKSIEFYQKYAGLEIKKAHGNLTFLGDPKEENGTLVELVKVEENAFSGAGISIGFEVEDAEGYREMMEKDGFEPSPMRSPSPTTHFFFVKDPNGVRIQFIQH